MRQSVSALALTFWLTTIVPSLALANGGPVSSHPDAESREAGANSSSPSKENDRQGDAAEPPDGETKNLTQIERAKKALAEAEPGDAPSDEELCTNLVRAAQANELPVGFFTNLIWQESRFDHTAISHAGAMGVAQFMPAVADNLNLNAFDVDAALPASARLLATLERRFGNLGLAAAAYNAGPKRVADWLANKTKLLPKETRDYVQTITGRPAEHWKRAKPISVVFKIPRRVPCHAVPEFAEVQQAERTQQEAVAEARRPTETTRKKKKAVHGRPTKLGAKDGGSRRKEIDRTATKGEVGSRGS